MLSFITVLAQSTCYSIRLQPTAVNDCGRDLVRLFGRWLSRLVCHPPCRGAHDGAFARCAAQTGNAGNIDLRPMQVAVVNRVTRIPCGSSRISQDCASSGLDRIGPFLKTTLSDGRSAQRSSSASQTGLFSCRDFLKLSAVFLDAPR
jgi:hypothetical protein